MFEALPNEKYQVIYADPPWKYKQGLKHMKPDNHYNTMTTEDISTLPVRDIADDNSLLFMWVTSPFLKEGIEIGEKWGFKYKSMTFVWVKEKGVPGPWTFQKTELCLLFTRGSRPKPKGSTKEHQLLIEAATIHSKKPDEIRKRIERISGENTKKIELFARNKVPGWDSWGNEI